MTFFESCSQSEATSLALLSAVTDTHTVRSSREPGYPEACADIASLRPPAPPVRVYRHRHGG